jgi:PAB1-binding protein PBP1
MSFTLSSHHSYAVLCYAVLRRLINRELVAWTPDENIGDPNLFALEDSGEQGWDQFAVNRKKFGYESGWNEDFYTVKLDKNK